MHRGRGAGYVSAEPDDATSSQRAAFLSFPALQQLPTGQARTQTAPLKAATSLAATTRGHPKRRKFP